MKRLLPPFFLALASLGFAASTPPGYFYATPELARENPELQAGLFYHGTEPVWIRGINWWGIGVQDCDPHGLWTTDYLSFLERLRDAGFNAVRLLSNGRIVRAERLGGDTTPITCVAFEIGSNRNLEGKSQYEMLRILVEGCAQVGLMVLIDHHGMGYADGVWYEEGSGTAEDYIADLAYVARDFRQYQNVIGLDIFNEPWKAAWGNGEANDFRAFAQSAGEAILEAAPEWMVCVEGMQYFHNEAIAAGTPLPEGARNQVNRGENLAEVRVCPLALPQHKVIFSPHIYGGWHGSYVNEANAFRFDEILPPINEYRWGYLSPDYAVMPGEFGSITMDEGGRFWEQAWLESMVGYMSRKDLPGSFYWCANPDVLGVMSDWETFRESKLRLLRVAFGLVEASGRDLSLRCERDRTVYNFPLGTFEPQARLVHAARASGAFEVPPHPGLQSLHQEFQLTATSAPRRPYRIITHYTVAQLRDLEAAQLTVYHWEGAQWTALDAVEHDPATRTLSFETEKTGIFAVFGR